MGKVSFDSNKQKNKNATVVLGAIGEPKVIIQEKIVEVPVDRIVEVPVEKIVEKTIEVVRVHDNTQMPDFTVDIEALHNKVAAAHTDAAMVKSNLKKLEQLVDAKNEETSDLVDGIYNKISEISKDNEVTRSGLIFIQKQQINIMKEQRKSAKIHMVLGIITLVSLILHIF